MPNFRLIYSAIGSGNTVGVVNSEFDEKQSINNGASVVWPDLTEDFGDVVGDTGKELGDLRVCLITEGGNDGPAVRFSTRFKKDFSIYISYSSSVLMNAPL